MVYFVQAGSFVKIGRARDVQARVREMQCGCPLELRVLAVAETPDDCRFEARLHRAFARQRVRGEWFRATPTLMEVVDDARGRCPLPGSFEDMCRRDERLRRLAEDAAERLGVFDVYCREVEFERRFEPRLDRLVGWGSMTGPLRTRAAYDVAAAGIRALMAPCSGCGCVREAA